MMLEPSPSETSQDAMLARAEAAIAALRGAYRAQLASDVEQLFGLWGELEAGLDQQEFLNRVHAVAHDIKGQGGSFGYDLATDIGASLSAHSAQEGTASFAPNILHLHFRMLRAVSTRDLAGDGGDTGHRFRMKLASLGG